MTVGITGQKFAYAGNGGTTAFAFPRPFQSAGDLRVVLVAGDGTETVQALTSDYTVSTGLDEISSAWATSTAYALDAVVSNGGSYFVCTSAHTSATVTEPGVGASWATVWRQEPVENGGEVNMVTAPASGETLVISRRTDLKQETDYQTGGAFSAEGHEDALDKLILIAQDLQEQIDRAIKLKESTTSSTPTFPEPEASRFIGWNGSADQLINLNVADIGSAVFPASSEDNTLARFDGPTGKALQGSGIAVGDDGDMLVPGTITSTEGLIEVTASGTVNAQFLANAPMGEWAEYMYHINGANYWRLSCDPGFNFYLRRFTAGVYQDTPIFVDDSNGAVALANALTINGSSAQIDSSGGVDLILDPETEWARIWFEQSNVRLWTMGMHGSDDFRCGRFDDSGVFQDYPVTISQATGDVTIAHDIEMGAGGSKIISGPGSPESSVAAAVGSIYMRTDGGVGTSLYVKESGTGNTGWVVK